MLKYTNMENGLIPLFIHVVTALHEQLKTGMFLLITGTGCYLVGMLRLTSWMTLSAVCEKSPLNPEKTLITNVIDSRTSVSIIRRTFCFTFTPTPR